MTYYVSTQVALPFEEAVEITKNALKEKGFGVLTEIDVKGTLHSKLGVDFAPYRILGACNPRMAHKALMAEPLIGTMLPCNVIVREVEGGRVEVSAVDPVASMQAVDNPALAETAEQVREAMREVVDRVGAVSEAGLAAICTEQRLAD